MSIKTRIQNILCAKSNKQYKMNCEKHEHAYDEWMRNMEEKERKSVEDIKPSLSVEIIYQNDCVSGFSFAKNLSDILIFVEKDGCLSAAAQTQIAVFFEKNVQCSLVYADEDVYALPKNQKITQKMKNLPASGRIAPFMKPIPSPETFLSFNYFGSIFAIRRSAFTRIEWANSDDYQVNVYDFLLKAWERVGMEGIGHLDTILFHKFEQMDGSSIPENKDALEEKLRFEDKVIGADEKFNEIKNQAFCRRKIAAEMKLKDGFGYPVYQVDTLPLISILIPSKDNPKALETCIYSIRTHSDYMNFEIIVIDNGSSEENQIILRKLAADYSFTYLYEKMEFNYSEMNNIAASHASGEYLLMLNDDMEVVTEGWMFLMLGQLLQDGVGAVGAKLIYPGTTLIQHVGVTNAVDGPVHKLMKKDDNFSYHHGRNRLVYNTLAVTGACLMLSKSDFLACNGLDKELKVAYNDVDLCFKLYEMGKRNVIRNDVVLYHHESLSRGADSMSAAKMERLKIERDYLYGHHRGLYRKDPYEGVCNAGGADIAIRFDLGFEEGKDAKLKPILSKKDYTKYPDGIYVVFERLEKEQFMRSKGEEFYCLQGFAVVPDVDNSRYSFKMVFMGENANYEMPLMSEYRSDLTERFPGASNLKLSGFFNWVTLRELPKGTYTVGIFAKDNCSRRRLFQNTEKTFEI